MVKGRVRQAHSAEKALTNDRKDIVVSIATGHQVAENGGRGRRQYRDFRNQKIKDQMQESNSKVLQDARIYINGYLDNTTDIEMKRIISSAGGRVMFAFFCACDAPLQSLTDLQVDGIGSNTYPDVSDSQCIQDPPHSYHST